uniref:Uncharacterized protein n=1 Tax=Bosea sp. NBC_00436 TaxID=2969620 RepID=A0A9E8CKI8_9HYPH
MRQIANKVRLWLRYQLGSSDLDLRLQELKGVLELNFQEIKRGMAAQSAAQSADHMQTLSALGLLIADQKATLQQIKERGAQRDPVVVLEVRLDALQGVLEKQSAEIMSVIGLLVTDQKGEPGDAGDVTRGEGQPKRASQAETSKDDHA